MTSRFPKFPSRRKKRLPTPGEALIIVGLGYLTMILIRVVADFLP